MFPNTSSQPSPRPIKVPSVTAFDAFLPKVLTAEETTALVASLIKSLGLTNRKEMGKIMKEIQASGKAVEGPLVKSAVDALLPA